MNPEEFSQLYLPLADGLYRVAFRLLDSQAEAEDAVQDLFIKLWIGRDSLEGVRSPEAWSLTLLRNLCIDRIRARGGPRPETVPDDLPEPPPPERPEHFDRALQAVRRLSGRERQLLRFRLTEGLSYEEIARRTGQSPKALRVAFHRIKDKLKRQI